MTGRPANLEDSYYFHEGTHCRLFECLGAHIKYDGGKVATLFRLWAPNAARVSVIGDFNGWNIEANHLCKVQSGIWECTVEGLGEGQLYKYNIRTHDGRSIEKADPFAYQHEVPPKTASVIRSLDYQWSDDQWVSARGLLDYKNQPLSVYELHLGSWMKHLPDRTSSCSYRGAAQNLVRHIRELGFSHVEFLPLTEYPFDGSWGYQVTGYFAPTSRFGCPQELMFLIDMLHQNGIGVILDWVPGHFPFDPHGLADFDGTALFEHADPRRGYHPDWHTAIFDYDRLEVRSFLLSSAHFWFKHFHVDGIRVDAVASMLYLDYSREDGQWLPNVWGGRENIGAIEFLRTLNETVHREFPGALMIAEESTAWPGVCDPIHEGGLGFDFKWDMGWMHDTLAYLERDPIHRKHHQDSLTFRQLYAFKEKFLLPLSHDEVVHGKKSLLSKMPGDNWQRFANLRLLLANMYTQPGKKLLFMGAELGDDAEWDHQHGLRWDLYHDEKSAGLKCLISELNRIYRSEEAFYQGDCMVEGFSWVDFNDKDRSVVSFMRNGLSSGEQILIVCNYTPMVHYNYRVGVPSDGYWGEILNTDDSRFGGSGLVHADPQLACLPALHGQAHSLSMRLSPLAISVWKPRLERIQ